MHGKCAGSSLIHSNISKKYLKFVCDVSITLIYTSLILQLAQAIEVSCLFELLPLLSSATKRQLSKSKWMNSVGAYLGQLNFENGLFKALL